MRRILLLLFLWCGIWLTSAAQTGLFIENMLNGKYASDPKVTETFMSGGGNKFLKKNHLTSFATFRGPATKYGEIAERWLLKDAEKANGKNVRYKGGKLYYGMYSFTPLSKKNGVKRNRYIYYLNNGVANGENVLIIYMEGTLLEDEADKLVRSMIKGVK